jgi:thiol-disulfide isomerase/thioredoxin
MNCTRCHTGIPDQATFCPQCGSPTAKAPFFQPEPQELQHTSPGTHLLIGTACVLGALMMIGMFIGVTLWTESFRHRHGETFGRYAGPIKIENIKAGEDFNLYGKTLNNEDFDWESFRGKYVLVKFTATWCGPCIGEIPGMMDAYQKYHDRGLEIVSVYIGEDGRYAATTIKQFVEKEKLPWHIISEPLTERAGQPPQGKVFAIESVPTMLLVDKEGKVLATETRGETLTRELKKLFDE